MANINYANKEIIIKIVYYGPGMSGKTTNLQVLHQMVPKDAASRMISLATEHSLLRPTPDFIWFSEGL